MINIKLDKCGGLTDALVLARAARAAGIGLMVGNVGGTSPSMAPAFLVAQFCDFVDLDGPLLARHDRIHPIRYERGVVSPPRERWG